MESAHQNWFDVLDDEDRQFIRRFVLASGSLKALAHEYNISYPTVRNRLDRLIAKIKVASEAETNDPFRLKVQLMVADGTISPSAARGLLDAHRASLDAEREAP